MKKRIEKNDLYQLHLLSGLKASPSGNRLVYVHTQMAKASDTYEKSLWLLEGGKNFCIYQKQQFSTFLWEDEHTLLIQKPSGYLMYHTGLYDICECCTAAKDK